MGLFGGVNKKIVCPRCLKMTKVRKDGVQFICPECGIDIPIRYVQYYENVPPFFVQLFGWSGHGKTMFLDVMRLMLKDMDKLWHGFTYVPLSQLAMEHDQILESERLRGEMPGSTQKRDRNNNEVYIFQLNNMPRWQNRAMIIMDHPGELFEQWAMPVEDIPFLTSVPTTFMIIGLTDLQEGQRADQMLNIYLETMAKLRVNFTRNRRKLVVVFTKADAIADRLPPELKSYLMLDTTWGQIRNRGNYAPLIDLNLAQYIERMDRVSEAIKDWVRWEVPGGSMFITLAEQFQIDASYSLISATGHDIDHSDGEVQLSPRRVLDPFMMALDFQSYFPWG